MRYQDCVDTMQATDEWSDGGIPGWLQVPGDAQVNAATGLATDYLNHFIEAIMLLEMIPSCPDCRDDFFEWRPMTYREHFAASRFSARELAIAAYDRADATARGSLDALAGAMTAMLEATRAAMVADMPADAAGILAARAAAWLRPLVARAGAVINGVADGDGSPAPQGAVDALLQR
ncbi:MAG: hypothetical protein ACK4UO_04545 [Pseudolabrys sp.]